ncbi:MAG: UDP-N-acetylmuramoyl-tripeptide--D-alanyl-D-alanine ligase [Alphaproteobacteria bacterium]|nr:UDP-N-acetylmuramoyl-tripeptide--D-alanyl-D-alanine ligase [Alphaproteobacteria bacterium]
MIEYFAPPLVFIAYLAFAARRLLTYLHAYQQEEYDSERFLRWVLVNRVFDTRLSAMLVACGIVALFLSSFMTQALTFFAFLTITVLEKDPTREAKKKLVLTDRVKRILGAALAVAALIGMILTIIGWPLLWIIPVQAMPLFLVLGNMALQPYEDSVQKKLWAQAHEKLARLKPKVIAITGSFGKTSVKHMLGHVLKMHAPTLITPGSVNTPMGVTRIIRENLDETHQYFVVEMGAYGPGSINIGHAHYERFKTLETVADAKYELAHATIEKNGIVVAHERTLRFPIPRAFKDAHEERFVIAGEVRPNDITYLKENDVHITRAVQMSDGIQMSLRWKDKEYNFSVPLYGLHHAHNVALTFAAALSLGLPSDSVITALQSVPQIAHRLEVKKRTGGITIIDDAYNSNPVGFRCALDLLATLNPAARKILVTPGMVELGAAHEEAHSTIGQHAGKVCDIALVVGPQRIPSFVAGFEATGKGAQLVPMENFSQASAWIEANAREGDVILLENDLPDIYERVPKL